MFKFYKYLSQQRSITSVCGVCSVAPLGRVILASKSVSVALPMWQHWNCVKGELSKVNRTKENLKFEDFDLCWVTFVVGDCQGIWYLVTLWTDRASSPDYFFISRLMEFNAYEFSSLPPLTSVKSVVKRLYMNEIRAHKHIEKCICYKCKNGIIFKCCLNDIGLEITENVLINY